MELDLDRLVQLFQHATLWTVVDAKQGLCRFKDPIDAERHRARTPNSVIIPPRNL